MLFDHDRLDGYVNFAYRALKADRVGRARERRLDAAESVPWLLDTVFAFAGRVRPYNGYLPWELATHPLPGWPDAALLRVVDGSLAGDPGALRSGFAQVESQAAAYDARAGGTRAVDMVASWGDELALLRG